MDYKISIIVPIYNSEKHLKKCLDSIINQTYKSLEIILVDDGSTDSSGKIADEYKRLDERVKVIHKKNDGVSIARNVGLTVSSGDYVGFVDSDDWIESKMYETLLDIIIEKKVDISICNLFFQDENGNDLEKFDYDDGYLNFSTLIKQMFFSRSIQGYTCNKLYKASLLKEKNVLFNNNIFVLEDDLFNIEILSKNIESTAFYSNKRLYHYIKHESSVSNRKFNEKNLSYFVVRIREVELLENLKLDVNYLKLDYCSAFIRAKILMKKYKIKKTKLYYDLLEQYWKYKSEIKFNNLNLKLKIKYIIVKYFNWIYNLKIFINREI